MKGMLLKSWKNLYPSLGYYLFFFAVFFVVSALDKNPLYFSAVGVMAAVALPLASMARDESDGWDAFAVASGISRTGLAASRYLFALVCAAPVWLCSFLLLPLTRDRLEGLATILLFCGVSMLSVAVLMPLAFRFGVEKSRVLLLVVALLFFLLALALGILLFGEEFEGLRSLPLFALPGALLSLGVVSLAVSVPLGLRILRTKDL